MGDSLRRCLVVGAGAVGLGVASFLHRAGVMVSLLARGNNGRALREGGIQREGSLGAHTVLPGEVEIAETLGGLGGRAFDAVFVCVKAYDSADLARDLARNISLLARGGSILLCQNGWGSAEIFARHLPATPILSACVFTGFERRDPVRVAVTGHFRPMRVGSLSAGDGAGAAAVCAALTAGGLPADPVADIGRDLWEKMLFNCSVNPLGALLRATVGELASAASLRPVLGGLVAEAFMVLRAAGFEARSRNTAEYLDVLYRDLAPRGGDHPPSMLQDLRRGRQTEIDALNGAVVSLGTRFGVAVRRHRRICELIRSVECIRGGAGSSWPPAAKPPFDLAAEHVALKPRLPVEGVSTGVVARCV
jgi:2-dehydropantoate 2-reductase